MAPPSTPALFAGLVLLSVGGGRAFAPPRRALQHTPHSHDVSPPAPRPRHAPTALRLSAGAARTPRDVLVIGGGLAGLSTAYHIATTSHRHVTLLERELPADQRTKTVAGSFAAAGMLAPQSERLPAGPLLDICLRSREMYGGWAGGVERGAREASLGVVQKGGRREVYTGEGAKYLWDLDDGDGSDGTGQSSHLEPWEVGFHSTGGFLAPAFAGDAVATWSPQPNSGKAYWLDDVQVRELEPQLHPDVIGGWWFPEDASVDARRLTCSLRAACVGAGVQMNFGSEWEVKSLEMSNGTCEGVHLANGKVYAPNSIVVANGSWMRHLLPLPVTPHKGQSFSLRMPENAPPILSRVLFAQDTYIVPKADGRIIVGATVEPGRFDGDVTPSGLMHCLSEATRLIPGLGELPIEESWAGLRPTTPDKCPILGLTEQWDNVYLAGGYWRNGVLLAPKTGQLIGDLVTSGGDASQLPEEDQALLQAFSWDRFTAMGGGKALAANSRYAATFYPVHKRSTDGVAVSVGTELGFYEGAAAAKGDREKDRKAMFGISEEEEMALERAAGMGVGDAQAFSFGDEDDGWTVNKESERRSREEVIMRETVAIEADPDALTIGVKQDSDEVDEGASAPSDFASDLSSIYEQIKANKAKASESITMGEDPTGERPDPGFRIYHVDAETKETTEVPPFTSPGEFLQMKAEGKLGSKPTEEAASSSNANDELLQRIISGKDYGAETIQSSSEEAVGDEVPPAQNGEDTGSGEPLFDGYTAIREAYGEGVTAEETVDATRKARMSNRIKTSEIDESKIGVMPIQGSAPSSSAAQPTTASVSDETTATNSDLSSIYDKIRLNKAQANKDVEMGEPREDERPELDFTIYHVDSDTREVREVPPYTSPGEFLDSLEKEKSSGKAAVKGSRVPKVAVPNLQPSNGSDWAVPETDEKTLDGYQAIQTANSAASREEELRLMREARVANRAKASDVVGPLP
ncbi:hypothetical protein ACHAXT_008722 [Thalassiosira profunda]